MSLGKVLGMEGKLKKKNASVRHPPICSYLPLILASAYFPFKLDSDDSVMRKLDNVEMKRRLLFVLSYKHGSISRVISECVHK